MEGEETCKFWFETVGFTELDTIREVASLK